MVVIDNALALGNRATKTVRDGPRRRRCRSTSVTSTRAAKTLSRSRGVCIAEFPQERWSEAARHDDTSPATGHMHAFVFTIAGGASTSRAVRSFASFAALAVFARKP